MGFSFSLGKLSKLNEMFELTDLADRDNRSSLCSDSAWSEMVGEWLLSEVWSSGALSSQEHRPPSTTKKDADAQSHHALRMSLPDPRFRF